MTYDTYILFVSEWPQLISRHTQDLMICNESLVVVIANRFLIFLCRFRSHLGLLLRSSLVMVQFSVDVSGFILHSHRR